MGELKGNTATLVTSNSTSISIVICDDGESVQYKHNGWGKGRINKCKIVYKQDKEDVLGYNEPEEFYPAFYIYKTLYFIGEFLRDNIGQ